MNIFLDNNNVSKLTADCLHDLNGANSDLNISITSLISSGISSGKISVVNFPSIEGILIETIEDVCIFITMERNKVYRWQLVAKTKK